MGLFKILLVLVLPLFSQEVRDRKEINATLLEEKTRSDLEDFSAAEGFSPLCKEKSSGDEWDLPSRSVALISLRSRSVHPKDDTHRYEDLIWDNVLRLHAIYESKTQRVLESEEMELHL